MGPRIGANGGSARLFAILNQRRRVGLAGVGLLLLLLAPGINGWLAGTRGGSAHRNPFASSTGQQALVQNGGTGAGPGGAHGGAPAPAAHPTSRPSPAPSSSPSVGPGQPPSLPPAHPASGSKPRGLYQFLGNSHPEDAANPSIDGGLMLFTWSQVEPQRGVFNWGAIDGPMASWSRAGKKVGLRVYTASMIKYNSSWNNSTAGSATPDWVYADGARKVVETDGSVLPVYWDAAYQRDLAGMVQALASRYNGNPTVAFIQAPSGFDGESFVDGTANSNKLALWQSVGYSDTLWENTVFWTWRLYQAYVTKPVVAVLKGGQITGVNIFAPLAEHAVATGAWVNHNGLAPTPFGGTYLPELQKAGQLTGCMLEELARLPITSTGATQLLQEMTNALNANAEMVLLYPAEVQAGTLGTGTYQPAWASALQTAHAEIWR